MVYINGRKLACKTCITGHRTSKCTHSDRPLTEIRPKGRPASQCETCRPLRKQRKSRARCICSPKSQASREAASPDRASSSSISSAPSPSSTSVSSPPTPPSLPTPAPTQPSAAEDLLALQSIVSRLWPGRAVNEILPALPVPSLQQPHEAQAPPSPCNTASPSSTVSFSSSSSRKRASSSVTGSESSNRVVKRQRSASQASVSPSNIPGLTSTSTSSATAFTSLSLKTPNRAPAAPLTLPTPALDPSPTALPLSLTLPDNFSAAESTSALPTTLAAQPFTLPTTATLDHLFPTSTFDFEAFAPPPPPHRVVKHPLTHALVCSATGADWEMCSECVLGAFGGSASLEWLRGWGRGDG